MNGRQPRAKSLSAVALSTESLVSALGDRLSKEDKEAGKVKGTKGYG